MFKTEYEEQMARQPETCPKGYYSIYKQNDVSYIVAKDEEGKFERFYTHAESWLKTNRYAKVEDVLNMEKNS